uniref:C-type lectin n=1 Tax=Timema bartmani TaxID=61472 RepID=A0A7R9EP67_9NEOP|nr:unnamed protein product [Timema bartmani]
MCVFTLMDQVGCLLNNLLSFLMTLSLCLGGRVFVANWRSPLKATMSPLRVIFVVLQGVCIVTADIKAGIESSKIPFTETFIYFETQYIFFSERVTWDEGAAICPSYKAQLAIVDDIHKAEFLAETIADSNNQMEDIWIGGRKINELWMWTGTGVVIPSKPNGMGFPPWVYHGERKGKECLAMDRRGHDAPLFVDLSCKLSRPFICEKSGAVDSETPVTSRRLRAGSSQYTLYHARFTWNDAVSFCRQNGKRLAIIPNKETAMSISQAMTKARPDFESAWIGGQHQYGQWVWVSTGQKIPHSTNMQTGYPPWRYNHTKKATGCILLDRHICDVPVFLETKCSRTRDFVCEEILIHQEDATPLRVKHKNKMFEVVPLNRTWAESSLACQEKAGHLVTLEDNDTLQFVINIMADYVREITHVWVGGSLQGKKWMWENSGEVIPFPSKNNYPPWCDNETRPDMACLNLDRADHSQPLFYGLECNNTQPFICQVDCTDPKPVKNGEWLCSTPMQKVDRRCQLECEEGRVAYGSTTLLCTVDGWVGNQDLLVDDAPPQCSSLKQNSKQMHDKLVSAVVDERPEGVMFVVEDSKQITEVEYKAELQFVDSIIETIPLSEKMSAGMVSFSDSSKVVMGYNQTDTCAMAELLGKKSKETGQSASYYEALKTAKEQIEMNQVYKKTLVVLVAGSESRGESYEKLVSSMTEDGHSFFTIGVGSNISQKSMLSIASVGMDNQPNFFHYKNFETLAGASHYMIDGAKKYQVKLSDFGQHDSLDDLDPYAQADAEEQKIKLKSTRKTGKGKTSLVAGRLLEMPDDHRAVGESADNYNKIS